MSRILLNEPAFTPGGVPPPPSGDWGPGPNAPSGLSYLYPHYDGTILPTSPYNNPNSFGSSHWGELHNLAIVTDVTKPATVGGNQVMRDQTTTDPTARFYMQGMMAANWKTLYVRHIWKADTTWYAGIKGWFPRISAVINGSGTVTGAGPWNVNNFNFDIWNAGWENGFTEACGLDPDQGNQFAYRAKYQLQCNQWVTGHNADGTAIAPFNEGPGWVGWRMPTYALRAVGTWVEYEWVFVLNTLGNSDGVVKCWLDGTQVINVTNAAMVPQEIAHTVDIGGSNYVVPVPVVSYKWGYVQWETTYYGSSNFNSYSHAGWVIGGKP